MRITLAAALLALVTAVVAAYGGTGAPSVRAGGHTLRYCSDISSPPGEFYGPNHKPQGVDIDLGNEIAKRLGREPKWINTAFAGIIPALQANHCDAILSELFIKPERAKVVDFVPYQTSGEELLVLKGNPAHITGLNASTCGKRIAAETGTTVALFLRDQAARCKHAGKPTLRISLFLRDSDAFAQLLVKHVDAYGTTTDAAGYRTRNSKQFETAGPPFGKIVVGIATAKDDKDLHAAIAKALRAIRADGTYARIYARWGLGLNMLDR